MLIGAAKRHQIKEQILNDLFMKPLNALEDKRGDLVVEGYKLWIEPYVETMKLIPSDFLCQADFIHMTVEADGEKTTTWTGYKNANNNDKPFVVMQRDQGSYRATSVAFEMPEAIGDKCKALETEINELKAEKEKMQSYLHESMEAWNTTHKLRTNWPELLHKYIPPEPPRAPRTKKATPEEVTTTIDVSDIQRRITLNILED